MSAQEIAADTRKKYRKLIDGLDQDKERACDPTDRTLGESLRVANELYDRVEKPREAALDSVVMRKMAEYGEQKAVRLKTMSTEFNPRNLERKMAELLDGKSAWQVAREVCPRGRGVVAPELMASALAMGDPIEEEKPQRARRVERDNMKNVETRTAEKVAQHGNDAQNRTPGTVKTIAKAVQERGQIGMWELIANPESFSQTVENLFCLSFLVKDSRVQIRRDRNHGRVMCRPVLQPAKKPSKQTIVTLNKTLYDRLVRDHFDGKQPVIPTRENASQA